MFEPREALLQVSFRASAASVEPTKPGSLISKDMQPVTSAATEAVVDVCGSVDAAWVVVNVGASDVDVNVDANLVVDVNVEVDVGVVTVIVVTVIVVVVVVATHAPSTSRKPTLHSHSVEEVAPRTLVVRSCPQDKQVPWPCNA